MRVPFALLAVAGAVSLSGCAYGLYDDGFGYGGYGPYGGSSVSIGIGYGGGYGGYGYGYPYGYGGYYGGYDPFGWYGDYYYPGTGIYVYDRFGTGTFGTTDSAVTGRTALAVGRAPAGRMPRSTRERIGRAGIAIANRRSVTRVSGPTHATGATEGRSGVGRPAPDQHDRNEGHDDVTILIGDGCFGAEGADVRAAA